MSRFGLGIDEEARDVARRWPYRILIAAALILLNASPVNARPAAADPDVTPSPPASAAPHAPACGRLLLTPTAGAGARGSLDGAAENAVEKSVEKPTDLIAAAPTASTSPKPRTAPTSANKVAAGSAPRLANTGQDIGAMVLLGLTLVLAGALLLIVRRRPKEPPAPAPAPTALYWVTAELPIVEPRATMESRGPDHDR